MKTTNQLSTLTKQQQKNFSIIQTKMLEWKRSLLKLKRNLIEKELAATYTTTSRNKDMISLITQSTVFKTALARMEALVSELESDINELMYPGKDTTLKQLRQRGYYYFSSRKRSPKQIYESIISTTEQAKNLWEKEFKGSIDDMLHPKQQNNELSSSDEELIDGLVTVIAKVIGHATKYNHILALYLKGNTSSSRKDWVQLDIPIKSSTSKDKNPSKLPNTATSSIVHDVNYAVLREHFVNANKVYKNCFNLKIVLLPKMKINKNQITTDLDRNFTMHVDIQEDISTGPYFANPMEVRSLIENVQHTIQTYLRQTNCSQNTCKIGVQLYISKPSLVQLE